MSIATAAAAGPTLTPAEMLERVRAWVYALAHRYADRAGVSVEDFAHELRVEMFIRAANFNPAKDMHMHEGTLTIVNDDTIEFAGVGWVDGKPAPDHCPTMRLVRKK